MNEQNLQKLTYAARHVLGRDVMVMSRSNWYTLVRNDGSPTLMNDAPEVVAGVLNDAIVVAVAASGKVNRDPGFDIVRLDEKDAPYVYNVDHYQVVERLTAHPQYNRICQFAGITTTSQLETALTDNVFVIKRLPSETPDHWRTDLPQRINIARHKAPQTSWPSAIENELDRLRKVGAQAALLASTPKPLLLIEWKGSWHDQEFESELFGLTLRTTELVLGREAWPYVRCVDIERLPVILRQGCDVEPSDSVVWVDQSQGKALEYGGDCKVMMLFDVKQTEPSYQEVPSDTPQAQLEEVRQSYPTVVKSIDGSKLWCSRLREDDRRVTSGYEAEHGRWIPGDPFEALVGVWVFGRNIDELRTLVSDAIANCEQSKWK